MACCATTAGPTLAGAGAARPPLRGRLETNVPMSRHTSWRVGGPADRFYAPTDEDDLAAFLATLPAAEPVIVIGMGSNLLVRDGGIRGTVICVTGMKELLAPAADYGMLAGAGVSCAKAARFSARSGLRGAEFLAGIPGSVGGALAMNAGAAGGETWGIVEQVETLDRRGRRRRRAAAAVSTGYRRVDLPADEWFLRAVFQLAPDPGGSAAARIRELLAARAQAQPLGRRSCGSVFKNPPEDFAGRLVEACGLKGASMGKARVSEKHANFIINDGGARAADIESLVLRVQAAVEKNTGVRLEPEVRIVGEPQGGGREGGNG